MFKVELAHPNAKVPVRQSAGAAGYDLAACEDKVISGHGWGLVSTGLKIEIPEGTYARVAPRSGLSLKGICVGAGVVDYDYRGIVGVVLYNHDKNDFQVKVGDRIAQLILEQIMTPEVICVDEPSMMKASERGASGFGSTGLN